MFRFTIRDLLWLMVVVGMALGWWAEHRWVATRTLRERFEYQAGLWEAWCDRRQFSSDFKAFVPEERVAALTELGPDIIPMIFDRWKPPPSPPTKEEPQPPPWWVVLERLTGKKMVSDEEKLTKLPANLRAVTKPNQIIDVLLEEKR